MPTADPPGWNGYVAAYDPVHRRLYLHLGMDGSCWRLDLNAGLKWERIEASGGPPARRGQSVMYDPVRDRLIVYGGDRNDFFGTLYGDVWALSLGNTRTWSQLAPTGQIPAGRNGHPVTYDPPGDRMIVFGGYTALGFSNDVFALTLSEIPTWSRLAGGAGPIGRRRAAIAYDSARRRVIMLCGEDSSFSFFNDVWALTLSGTPSWSELEPTGVAPRERGSPAAVYDPVGDRILLSGGFNGFFPASFYVDVWELHLSGAPAWSQLTPGGQQPRNRSAHYACYDALEREVLVYGGESSVGRELDTWALSLRSVPEWRPIVGPPIATSVAAVYDPLRQRMLVWGATGDAWALSLEAVPRWTLLQTYGTGPPPRSHPVGVYDPIRDRMIVFGGVAGGSYCEPQQLNDVWALSLSGPPTWSEIRSGGSRPSPRQGAAGIYDPVRDQLIVIGGVMSVVTLFDGGRITHSEGRPWSTARRSL